MDHALEVRNPKICWFVIFEPAVKLASTNMFVSITLSSLCRLYIFLFNVSSGKFDFEEDILFNLETLSCVAYIH